MLKNDDDLAKIDIVKDDGTLCKLGSKKLRNNCGLAVSYNCKKQLLTVKLLYVSLMF
jgi:hypothetical protein